MAEISYSTLALPLGSKTQFLHNLSLFLYTTSSGRGLRCSLSSISVLPLLQAKGVDEFRPKGARAAGRSRCFSASGKVARARVCRAERIYALASVCLTWRTGEFPSRFLATEPGYGRHFFRAEKNLPVRGLFLGVKQSRRSRVYDFASKTLQWCRSCLRRGFMRGWLPDNALNCDDASWRWRSRKRLRPQRAGIPCQSRMPHRPSSLERSLLPACRWPLRCRKAYR